MSFYRAYPYRVLIVSGYQMSRTLNVDPNVLIHDRISTEMSDDLGDR